MNNLFVESFVDKLILLESRTGGNTHYRIMPPITTPVQDNFSIQKTAKDIAKFIGMDGFTFIVGIIKQKEKVVGNIDLSTRDKNVFIEIDPKTLNFPNTISATLCHEICHKWLKYNGIQVPLEIDNEILTDITTVFLGLGKIILNGYKNESMKVGYLDLNQLAFVYALVCSIRKIPPSDFMSGLNDEVKLAVEESYNRFNYHHDYNFHAEESIKKKYSGFNAFVNEVQYTAMADLNKSATFIEKSLCETIDVFLKAGHKKLNSLNQEIIKMSQHTSQNPALRLLQDIKIEFELERQNKKVLSVLQETNEMLQHLKEISQHLSRNNHCFPQPSSEMFNIVTCPKDGTKLRLPENSGNLIVTCPKCKYRFAYNTTVVSF